MAKQKFTAVGQTVICVIEGCFCAELMHVFYNGDENRCLFPVEMFLSAEQH